MLEVAWSSDPTHYVRRALTAVLGIPVVARDLVNSDGKDLHGNDSKRVMCITNKHVTSSDTTRDYEYGKGKTQHMLNCDGRRFQRIVNETREITATKLLDIGHDVRALAAADKWEKQRGEQILQIAQKDVVTLADFLQLLNSTWSDDYQRIIGYLDWAPKLAKNHDSRSYTCDLGVIALDESKLRESFQGNSVYLGLASPYLLDENGNAGFIEAKDGQSTALKFGRCSELEAYTCDKSKQESWEVAVLNYSRKHRDFSSKGDSGAAIFNAEGKLFALLHSGMPRGTSNHISFGTPGYYVVELVKGRYPDADLDRVEFDA
ncbi:hypothetical protein BC835DRAFT_1409252 [Cytidiella melzeri]|nr:hypothetical protein BC835DRAFT_1409252 [Cytidiella melzeri]